MKGASSIGPTGERRERLLTPRAREIARELRKERWYEILSEAPHRGAQKLAATLLIGAVEDELREDAGT